MHLRNFKTEGIVIKRRNIGEADKLLTVVTPSFGKIIIKASGVRRINSRRSPHVELLNHAYFTLYKASGMPTLIEAQTIEAFSPIKDDLSKVGLAYHLCELVDGLCPENQENRHVFSLIRHALLQLSQELGEVSLRDFEIDLLTHLGFYPRQMSQTFNTTAYIEHLLERKLKTLPLLARFEN